jgi:phenylpropionate dioxygenase-like ring-hydroxylating dioxygenase large terminal subunit
MYPLKNGQVFAFNQWYVAATHSEVGRDLLARRILDIPVVLYRTEAGDPVALYDVCPHRRFPLSKSRLVGDTIECGYHGFTFDCSGKCVKLPTGQPVPSSYGVRSFPVVERFQWIWIWMGDPEMADQSKIPDEHLIRMDLDGWHVAPVSYFPIKARYVLLHENLLDLSHLTFLHVNTIGSAGVALAKMEIKNTDQNLEITRRIHNDSMDGVALGRMLGVEGLVDRTMVQHFSAPSFHRTGSSFNGAEEGPRPGHYYGSVRVFHAVTPETPKTTHYYVTQARDFRVNDTSVLVPESAHIRSVITEDIFAAENVENMIDGQPKADEDINSRADTGALRGRSMIQKLIEQEQIASRH